MVRDTYGLLTRLRQLALVSVLAASTLLAWSAPARAACPGTDGDDEQACVAESDLPYVEEITAPPDGIALTFSDPD